MASATDNKVQFFNPNEVNSSATYDFTTASEDNSAFLYDNDVLTKLSSDGSSEGVAEVFRIDFVSSRPINFIGVYGHNFKTGTIKYLDGMLVQQDFDPPIAFVANDNPNSVFYFTEVECQGIVLSITNTIDAETEKSIGELRALQQFTELPEAKKFAPELKIDQNMKTKYDGGIDKVVDGIKFAATIGFDDLVDDDINILFDLAERGRPFYVYLSPMSTDKLKRFFRTQDQYLVNMTNNPKPKLPQNLVDKITWGADIKVQEV